MRTNPLPRLGEGIYTPLRTVHVGFVGVRHSLGPFLGPIIILRAFALFYGTTDTLRVSYNLPQRELENIRTHQSSGSLDFEVLIVGYDHVVMNYGSAGIRYLYFPLMFPAIKQLWWDEYGFVIHPGLVGVTCKSVRIDV
nr:hypothetical protein [Tanacetum cinerariifolium]